MKKTKTPAPKRAGNAMVDEFARLALELATLNPGQLFALGEELRADAESNRQPSDCSLVPNKTS